MMEFFYSTVAVICAVFLSVNAWKFLNWVWFKPREVERRLREQGFNGNSYRFFIGDMKEMATMAKEAHIKTIKFSNDIVPKVMPFIQESIKKYGENCFIWFGANPVVLISSPEMVKEILSKNYVFQKNNAGPIHKLFAQGLAASETDKWAKHRKLINPAFHMEKLKHMVPSFYLSCAEMLSKWEEIVPSEGSCELDVSPYLQTMTSDVISRTAFGSNFEEGRKIFELLKEQGRLILKALQMLYIPGWRFLPTKTKKRMKQIVKEVDSSILGIIKKRMHVVEAGEANSRDLLGILLESNFNEVKHNGNEFGMSLQEVIEECKLFYVAGQETTSNLLVWTMILLGKHLDWQARAREEVLQVLGSNRKPDFEELNRLKIITMIFYEVLRLYPPLPLMNRYIHKETTIGNLTLPAGIQLFLPKILLHHESKIWGDDAKEFNPERFSEGISKATKGQFSYFPFSAGPRVCIGQNFAMLEAKMAMAMILQCYSFEISPSYAHAPEVVLTLESQYGAQLIFRRV